VEAEKLHHTEFHSSMELITEAKYKIEDCSKIAYFVRRHFKTGKKYTPDDKIK